jgi:hypothetical protein
MTVALQKSPDQNRGFFIPLEGSAPSGPRILIKALFINPSSWTYFLFPLRAKPAFSAFNPVILLILSKNSLFPAFPKNSDNLVSR